jgi:hypothetical protein
MQLDGNGNVYIEGQMSGADYTFPLINPVEPYAGRNWETFVAELNPTGSKLLFSTAIGNGGTGGGTYAPAGLAVDAQGNIYSAGNTNDTGLLFTPGAFQTPTDFGTQCCVPENGVVAKISAQSTATVALAVSSSPSQAGQAVTLTATVTPTQTYASVPTGTIEFQDESTLLSTVALNASGVATYATSSLTPNTHSLTAVYSGDSTYPTGSGSASLTITGLSATVKVTPAASSVSTASSLSVNSFRRRILLDASDTGQRHRHHHHSGQQPKRWSRYSLRQLQRRRQLRPCHGNRPCYSDAGPTHSNRKGDTRGNHVGFRFYLKRTCRGHRHWGHADRDGNSFRWWLHFNARNARGRRFHLHDSGQ